MTIGVLVSGLYEEYTKGICEGIKYIAEKDDINVVIIPGKYLELDLPAKLGGISEYQYNSSFSYGEVAGFDGLIIEMASVSMFASDRIKKQFTSHFQNIPHVYISYEEENTSNISIDNKAGMLEALNYLYDHGNREFIMIGGPAENVDAIVRKKTFFEFLEEKGLPHPESIYQDGDFIVDCTERINKLLDNNPNAEAFICANDILARNACDCLNARHIVPGRDISVLGYDDSAEACKKKPSLSSVRTDFALLGIESYKALLKTINGEKPENVCVPTKFIKRDSFVADKNASTKVKSAADTYNFENIIKKNIASIKSPELQAIEEKFGNLATKFTPIDDYIGRDDEVLQYIDAFSETINRLNFLDYIDIDLCRAMLRQRYEFQMKQEPSKDASILLTKIYMRLYHNMTNSLYYYFESEAYDLTKRQSIQTFSQDAFSFEHGDDSSFAHLLAKTDTFEVKNAFIYVYEEPKFMFHNEDFRVPEYLLLKAVMTAGKVRVLSSAKQRIHRSQILDNDFIQLSPDNAMMLLPLYCNEVLYGIIICDYPFSKFDSSGVFVSQLSSAVKMITTLRANDTLLSEYEDTLQVLKSNNIELDKLSKSDYLTGLMNRRGFRARAEEMLKTCREQQTPLMIIYADMNNLKIINDKYGHIDGDYALKQIARILKEVIKEKGIVGRIGGDEFACAIPYDGQLAEKQVIQRLYREFDSFNQSSDKDYIVGICAGSCIIFPSDDITLDQAVELADEKLYKEKQNRSKNIFKNTISAV